VKEAAKNPFKRWWNRRGVYGRSMYALPARNIKEKESVLFL